MKNSIGNSTGSTLNRSELIFLGKLEAARKLPSQASQVEKVWLAQGRRQGLDVEKVVNVLNKLEAKFRREHPDRLMPSPGPEAAASTTRST